VGVVLLVLSLTTSSLVAAQEVAAPEGFDQLLVYMATGVYDPDDPNYEAPDGDFWHREIMGRSDEEIEQNRNEAIAFFQERFGIDPSTHEGVSFMSFMFDPRNEYRAYVVSGREVLPEGWVIRDGGWNMTVTDPEGITLGGEFEGKHVPEGTMVVFGDYNIDTGGDPIIIHYQSGEPIIPSETGAIYFLCELISEDFGNGLAQGISAPKALEDGLTQANVRNVLTFPGLGNAN
jgi:hypothetical protein